MFGLTFRGIFGTQTWKDNPFKADGRDMLPALRRYRGEVRASELTTWGTIWRLAYVIFFAAVSIATIWLWMIIA